MPLRVLLRCHDLDATRHYYQALPGFEVRDTAEATLTVSQHGGGVLVFTAADRWGSAPGFSGTLYFSVPDVAAYFEQLKGRVTVAWPLQSMPYGSREFGIRDCNGYHLAFLQQI